MVTIESMNVHNMNDIRAIVSSYEFSEVDYGFFGDSSRIYDNNLDRGWIAFEAGASGSINVEGVTLEGNSGVRFVALASEGSIVVLDLVKMNDIVAEQTDVSCWLWLWTALWIVFRLEECYCKACPKD
jgi:hypothetical protein